MPRRGVAGGERGGGVGRGNKTPGSIARGCRAVHLTTYLIFELGRG